MKVTREKSEENRQIVIETAARMFRESGYDGVGVSPLMQAAGLTHGGFYKQFKSKDDLIAQATKAALDQTAARLAAIGDPSDATRLEAIIRRYLSEAHRDAPGQGCALAALGADAARHGPELRGVMEDAVKAHLHLLETSDPQAGNDGARGRAVAALATMVGALMLSRAVEDPALSSEILQTSVDALLAQDARQ